MGAQIQRARQHIKNSLDCVDNLVDQSGDIDMALASKLSALELENKALRKVTDDLKGLILKLENRVATLEGGKSAAPAAAPVPKKAEPEEEEDDDDVDLFGSDDEEEDARRPESLPSALRHTRKRRPRSHRSSPRPPFFSMSSPGTTRLTWTRWPALSRRSRWTGL